MNIFFNKHKFQIKGVIVMSSVQQGGRCKFSMAGRRTQKITIKSFLNPNFLYGLVLLLQIFVEYE